MVDITKITDSYERKARIYPGLTFIIPIVIILYVLFPDVFNMWSGLIALLLSFGVLQLLANLARDRGKKLEGRLYEDWDGMPSVRILRHRDLEIPKPAKQRYHLMLAQQTGINAPTEDLEASNPAEADQAYLSWSDYLRGKTRNKKEFPLVFKENVNYGFRRNLLGIKYFCLLSGFVSLSMVGVRGFQLYQALLEMPATLFSIFVAIFLYLLVFLFVVNRDWVKITAYAYARQLIESLNA